jgi:hypothetical protein
MSFGFSPANWAALKSALLNHALNNPVTSQTSTVPVAGRLAGLLGQPLDLAFAVSDSHGERRLLHRITIAGQKRS